MIRLKEHKGITLIALVITIIVLLILAGVTINSIMSQDGTPEKAVEARKKNDQGAEFDAIKLAVVGAMGEREDVKVDAESLKNELNGLVEDEGRLAIRDDNAPWIVLGKTGVKYRITNLGNVTVESGISIFPTTLKVGKTNEANQTINIKAVISKDMEYSSVTWDSSNKSVATVTGTGETATVKILTKGLTKISALISGSPTPAECNLTVVDTIDKATINPISVEVDSTVPLIITNVSEVEEIESCSIEKVTPQGENAIEVASVTKDSSTGIWNITGLEVPGDEESVETTLTITGKSGITKQVMVTVTPHLTASKIIAKNTLNSPYVKYTMNGQNEPTLCRVLYNDNTHGLQIITATSVATVQLGKNDNIGAEGTNGTLEKAKNSYNNAIVNLNNKAESYINMGDNIVTDARCVGSKALISEGIFSNKDEETAVDESTGYKGEDMNYTEDSNRIVSLYGRSIDNSFWLASRRIQLNSHYQVRFMQWNGGANNESLFVTTSDSASNYSYGFHPVFLIKSNVEVKNGDGLTADTAYILQAGN